MKTRRMILMSGIVAAGLFLSAVGTFAAASLSFNDGINPIVVIADGAAGDINPAAGQVTAAFSLGTWTINAATGVSTPPLGSITAPDLDLASGTVSTTAAGSLTIMFSDIGFGPSSGPVSATVGGRTSGSITFSGFADPGNALFATTTSLFAPIVVSGPTFSSSASGAISAVAPYSVTEKAAITVGAGGTANFDLEVRIVPEPSSVGLIVGGVALLFGLRSLRRNIA